MRLLARASDVAIARRRFIADLARDLYRLRDVVTGLDNVKVEAFEGLLVDFCRDHDVDAIVKGLLAVSDFDTELQMAQMNASLSGVETVFVPTSPEWSFLASSLVKEVARFGGDVSGLVPSEVLTRLTERLGSLPT